MKKLVIFILVLLVATGGVGYWRGWFSFNREDGSLKGHVDPEKFKKDRIALSARIKAIKDKVIGQKFLSLSAEEKTSLEKEHHELEAKHEKLESQLKELNEASADKFEDIKQGLEKDLAEVEKKMDNLIKKLEKASDK